MTDASDEAAEPRPEGFRAVAYNPVPESENRIHGDEVARQHGFRGGLVPGVVVSAYLADPALRAWGARFLAGGEADIVVHKPLYDGDAFEVTLSETSSRGYRGSLLGPDGALLAEARIALRDGPAPAPVKRGDLRVPRAEDRPPATREVLERLRREGLGATRARLDAEHEMARYHASVEAQPALVRTAPGGYANLAFLLGLTDWALARNVRLGPWLHLQTWSQHLALVPYGAEVTTEASIADLFERKGHAFVDIDVAVFDESAQPVMTARMRAIYRLRSEHGV